MPAPVPGGKRTALDTRQWSSTFAPAWGMFSPGEPLTSPDPQPVRGYDFPVGVNTIITPKAREGFGFAELRAFANVEIVRLAIETRKDQIERLNWRIKSREGRKVRKDADERIRKCERFFVKPDGYNDFHTWLRALLEDVFTIDAPALELRRTRAGDLIGLDLVPGDTIKILVDQNGRRPLPPAPAYQQIIKGRVWNDLTTRDLLYFPRNPRVGKLYGFSVVEQVVITINTFIQRQAAQLAWFTAGNVPRGMATVPDGWTVDQVKDWQAWMDASLSGNTAERQKILWAPAGSEYKAFKEPPIKDDFDEWLARIVCYAFSLPPAPFIKQMNRSTAQSDTERALEEGLAPLLAWVERLLTKVVREEFGFADLEFSFVKNEEIDPEVQAKIHDTYICRGAMTIDESRDERGLDPLPDGLGKKPLIYTATGAFPLEQVFEEPEPTADPSANPSDQDPDEGDDGDPEAPKAKPQPGDSTAKLARILAELMTSQPPFVAARTSPKN